MFQSKMKSIFVGCLAGCLFTVHVSADDVTDTIEEALANYKKGEYKKAGEDLTYALEIINQKKSNDLKAFLPEPLSGWTAEDATSQSAGAAMLGGGTFLTRNYQKDDASITIEMIMDAPMIQGMAMMFSNPMLLSSDGGELTRVKREKAIIKYQTADKSGEISILISNRILLTIKGDNVAKDDIMAYANAIDFDKLKSLN